MMWLNDVTKWSNSFGQTKPEKDCYNGLLNGLLWWF